jgi:hypothetical protein
MGCRYRLDSLSSNSRVDLDEWVDGALKLSETLLARSKNEKRRKESLPCAVQKRIKVVYLSPARILHIPYCFLGSELVLAGISNSA